MYFVVLLLFPDSRQALGTADREWFDVQESSDALHEGMHVMQLNILQLCFSECGFLIDPSRERVQS